MRWNLILPYAGRRTLRASFAPGICAFLVHPSTARMRGR